MFRRCEGSATVIWWSIEGSVTTGAYDRPMGDLEVEVVRSKRRKRTVQAYLVDGRLRVLVPAGLGHEEESRLVETMVARATRKLSSAGVDLMERAKWLAERYRLRAPSSIEWSDRQLSRWGSCTASEGRIRISNRLASMPEWVLDWVLVHELAHLEEANHGARFQELVGRYELGERAKGYLMSKSEERVSS